MLLFKFVKFLLISLSSFLITENLLSQKLSTPLVPVQGQPQQEIGIFGGIGQNWMTGSFRTYCDCPEFTEAVKLGYTIGLLYEQDFFSAFMFGGALVYDFRGVSSSYRINELVELKSQISGQTENTKILFRQKAEADFSYISAFPYIKWVPFKFMFFRIGPSVSFPISTKRIHEKELLQNTARLSNGEEVTVEIDGTKSTSVIVENGEFPDATSPFISLDNAIGFNLNLGTNVFLSPVFQYSLPLTTNSSHGNGFKIHEWRLFIEMRIGLKLRTL